MIETKSGRNNQGWWIWIVIALIAIPALLAVTAGVLAAAYTPAGSTLRQNLSFLFALNTVQTMWYVTRSAGLIAYLLLWLSTAWGLAVSSKIFDLILHRTFTYDFHQFISLLAVGFIVLHVAVLMADQYLPFSLAQILVPFLSTYRPLWVGIGVGSFYLVLLVTITFYLRKWIGMKTFRAIHVLSLVAYLGATVHGFYAGTDSPLAATQLMYAGTFLVIVFLTSYWLILRRMESKPAAIQASSPHPRRSEGVR